MMAGEPWGNDLDEKYADLRENMKDLVAAARVARDQRNIKEFYQAREAAIKLLLDHVGNGYITRLWNELESYRP